MSTLESTEAQWLDSLGLGCEVVAVTTTEPALSLRVLVVGRGQPVLCLHGLGSVGGIWASLAPSLPGCQLVCVDLPGCGGSGPIDYRSIDLRRHAVDVIESVANTLALPKFVLVGNSLGALWGHWYAQVRPERLRGLVQMGCPAGLLGTPLPLAIGLLAVRGLNRLLAALRPPGRRLLRQLGEHEFAGRAPSQLLAYASAARRVPGRARAVASLMQRLATFRAVRPEFSLTAAELAKVEAPALYVWGETDPVGDRQLGERAVRALPHGRLQSVPGGHLPWLGQPALCAAAIREFVSSIGGFR
jgi:pimeloyl-ACP methyl ester carboxylesterase